MWPWEHVAVGYLLYSAYVHLRYGDSPGTRAAVAVAIGALFPDLVDKPLSWTFAVLPSGVSFAHSVFTAVALSTAVVVVLDRVGHRRTGVAFGVAYLAHLPADALYPVLLGKPMQLQAYFWPLLTVSSASQGGFLDNFVYYLVSFVAFLGTGRGLLFLALEVTLIGTGMLLWIADGCPGLGVLTARVDPNAD